MSIVSGTAGAPPELTNRTQSIAVGADQARATEALRRRRRERIGTGDRDRTYRALLVLADVLAVSGVALAATIVGDGRVSDLAALLAIPLVVLVARIAGTYDHGGLLVRRTTLDEVPTLFQVSTLLAVVVWLLQGAIPGSGNGRRELVVVWLGLFALLVAFRSAARWLARSVTPPERCLLIGDPINGAAIQAKFERLHSLHAVVAAFVGPEGLMGAHTKGARAADLAHLTSELQIDRVVVASSEADEHELGELLDAAASAGCKVSVVPTVFDALGPPMEIDRLEGVPLLSTQSVGLPPTAQAVKRILDVLGATIVLIVFAPLLACAAVAVKLDSPGPVLFRQRRVGRDGRIFAMLKFRSMVAGAEEQQDVLRHLNEASGLFKIASDPRITTVGRVLRRLSLDELPQLLNVLRGEMSLVGPRPLVQEEDVRVKGWQRRRLHLKPGMTGHWQVSGSARIPLTEMARMDYLYVTNWSLWLDLKILIRTIPYVLSGKGL